MLPEEIEAQLVDIVDGDTIQVTYESTAYFVRLVGINAIESGDYNPPYQCKRQVDCGGSSGIQATWLPRNYDEGREVYDGSKQEMTSICSGTLKILSDQSRQFDYYDRLLGVVINDDGKNVGIEMLKGGYAAVSFYDYNKQVSPAGECINQDYIDAENIARSQNLGIWSFLYTPVHEITITLPKISILYIDGAEI